MQIARKINPSCNVQPVKTKVSSECCARSEHPEGSNWRILLALESRAISEHPPSIIQENSNIISGTSRSLCFALCRISSLISCLLYHVSSRSSSRVLSCVSKYPPYPEFPEDPDCPTYPECQEFLLLVRLTVESYDVRWPVRSQKQSKLTTKIDRKSIPGDAMGHPKSTQNRSRDPLWTPRGAQERPEGVSGASRERLGSVSERPRRPPGAPGGSPRAPRDAGKSARERLGARRGDQNRRQVSSRNEKIEFFSRGSFTNPFRNDFSTILVDFGSDFRRFSRLLRASKSTRCAKGRTLILTGRRGTLEGSRILRMNGKSTKNVEKIASRAESGRSRDVTSKNHEKRPENRPKIVENRVPGPLGRPPRPTFVARHGSVERLGASRGDSGGSASDSGRPSQSKWVDRGRSGRVPVAGGTESSTGTLR